MIKVGVTGLTGMVGRNLLDVWRADPEASRRYSPIALVRRASKVEVLRAGEVECRYVDYQDPASFAGKVEDLEAVVHLSGLTKCIDPRDYLRVNAGGTRTLLEALGRYGKRVGHLVFSSSTAAGGPSSPDGSPKDEGDPSEPTSEYGRSKLQAEALIRCSPFSWTICRLGPIFGPYDMDGLKLHRMIKRGILLTVGGREQRFSYLFAQDLGRLLLRMLLQPQVYREQYYVCYDEPAAAGPFYERIRSVLGLRGSLLRVALPEWGIGPFMVALELKQRLARRPDILGPDKLRELRHPFWVFSNRKLRLALGIPALREEGALAQTMQWFRAEGLL
jgi:nucleoside-diphosphate-sugar epimerase